jgi:hypothetical protein
MNSQLASTILCLALFAASHSAIRGDEPAQSAISLEKVAKNTSE